MDLAWAATRSWFLDHGWVIVLIIIGGYIVREFGLMLISNVINRGITSSDRFETERDRKLRASTLISLIDSIFKIVMWLIIILLVFRELGILKALTPLFAGAGIASIIIGLGTQAFIRDFISGLFIVAENQYRVGDVVEIGGGVGIGIVEGTITRISMRTTTIRDADGAIHVIPNGGIMRAANKTLASAKVNIEVKLPLDADIDDFERSVNDMGQALSREEKWHKKILESPHFHGVLKFDESHIITEVRAKTVPAEQWHISSEIKKRLVTIVNSKKYYKKSSNKTSK